MKIPKVPLIPASIHIQTKKPKYGWWTWNIEFFEENYENMSIVPWKNSTKERRKFETTLDCSDVLDPVTDLHWFLYHVKNADRYVSWTVDEEGCTFTIEVWHIGPNTVQINISTKDRIEDISWDFVLDRSAFIAEIDAAYTSFGAQGGWGVDWGDRARKDDSQIEILIDSGDVDKNSETTTN